MIHIICHDFKSTSGNHAGMRHLYQEIAKRNTEVDLHILNDKGVGVKYCNRILSFWTALKVAVKYKKGDKYLFTEDIFKGSFHTWAYYVICDYDKNEKIIPLWGRSVVCLALFANFWPILSLIPNRFKDDYMLFLWDSNGKGCIPSNIYPMTGE